MNLPIAGNLLIMPYFPSLKDLILKSGDINYASHENSLFIVLQKVQHKRLISSKVGNASKKPTG